jgi:hypothetical protein
VTENTGTENTGTDEPAAGESAPGGPAAGETSPEERRALFRIVRGEPSDEEVAALTAVLLAAASAARPAAGPPVRDRWSDPAARMRRPLTPGPGAWRASALPR